MYSSKNNNINNLGLWKFGLRVVRGGLGRSIGLGLRVVGNSLVGHISNITVVVVSGVVHGLGPAIRKSNGVGSSDGTVAIRGLSSVEGSLGVVISNTILVGVGLRSLLVLSRGVIGGSRLVGRGRGVVGGGLVHNRGMGDNRGGMVSRGMMDNRGSMVSRGVLQGQGGSVDGMTDSGMAISGSLGRSNLRQTLVVVSLVDGSMASTEGLGHLNVTYLSISLGNRLVASLSSIPIGGSCVVGVDWNGNSRGEEGRGAQESLHGWSV